MPFCLTKRKATRLDLEQPLSEVISTASRNSAFKMAGLPDSSQPSTPETPLPEHFESIESIKNMPNDRLKNKPLVNVIGLVKDYQPPIQTQGTG